MFIYYIHSTPLIDFFKGKPALMFVYWLFCVLIKSGIILSRLLYGFDSIFLFKNFLVMTHFSSREFRKNDLLKNPGNKDKSPGITLCYKNIFHKKSKV